MGNAPSASPQGPHTDQFTGPVGYSPLQLNQAYETTAGVSLGGISGNGAGQTIAIIDPGDNPAFLNFSGGVAGGFANLQMRSGVSRTPPASRSTTVRRAPSLETTAWDTASTTRALRSRWTSRPSTPWRPTPRSTWSKPGNSNLYTTGTGDLMQAAATAASLPGVSVVTMSFGANFESAGDGAYEQFLDNTYLAPALAANPGVTFLASTGDTSNGPGDAPNYPSVSPLVVAVGGTSLNVSPLSYFASSYSWGGETAWYGGGGGVSNTYSEPTWQESVQSTGARTVPDISSDADPEIGLAVYDPFDFGASTPWAPVGGTSLSAPSWAGLIAIADQGLAIPGNGTLNGPSQTLPALLRPRRRWDQLCSSWEQLRWEQLLPRHHAGQ